MLKDINAPETRGIFDLRKQLETSLYIWWKTIANWCELILNLNEEMPWPALQKRPIASSLRQFSFIQIKKEPGRGTVEEGRLWEASRRDVEYIREQLAIYHPSIVIGAGVGRILAQTLGTRGEWQHTTRGVGYVQLQITKALSPTLIDYVHPSIRAPKNLVCYGLLDAYREIARAVGVSDSEPQLPTENRLANPADAAALILLGRASGVA